MSDEDVIPSGVLRKRKGWEGDEMELNHHKEKLREGTGDDTIVAVDLKQFQNHVVGEGYQAKHVVRQRSAVTQSQIKTLDMTHNTIKFKSKPEKKKNDKLLKYLRCNGMREFRRQLEEILKSS